MIESNCLGNIELYKKMYDIVKKFELQPNEDLNCDSHFLTHIDMGLGDLALHWEDRKRIENEHVVFNNVKNAYDDFIKELENALGGKQDTYKVIINLDGKTKEDILENIKDFLKKAEECKENGN